jgi:hypothetical protein
MNTLLSFVKRNRVLSFIVLTYIFSWWPWLLFGEGVWPVGPFIAALVVLGLSEGKAGVMSLLGRMVHWRVGIHWYLVALGLPILLSGVASYLAVLLGAPVPSMEQFALWPEIPINFLIMLVVPGLGGAWEEPGWRGYALHQLETGRSRLWAMLPLWAIIVAWHLPLFFTGGIEWADVFAMIGGVIIYNWLYHRSGHSVLLVMIIHSINNAVSGEFFSPMFTGVYSAQQAWMRVLVWGVVAAVVLIANWRWWTESEHGAVEAPKPIVKPA